MPNNNGARGNAYEPYAIQQYAQKYPELAVFGDRSIPDALLAMATGRAVTADSTKELKRQYNTAVDELIAGGKEPKALSRHFGMDGVSVDSKAWSMRAGEDDNTSTDDVFSSLRILECKLPIADAHVLGPTTMLQFHNLAVYGPQKMPPLTLLSPHKPTPAVFNGFDLPLHRKFHHELIREAPSSSISAVGEATATETIDFFQWQRTVSRRTVARWKSGTALCVANVVMGLGKTVAGWLTLKDADKWPLRIFCAHTTDNAKQILDEAALLGIRPLDLTHLRRTNTEVDAVLRSAAESSTDSSSESGDSPEEASEPGLDAAECTRLVQMLTDLSSRATRDRPVYVILCHATLRALATNGIGKLQSQTALVIDESHKLANGKAVYDAIFDAKHNIRTLLTTATHPKTWDVGRLGTANATALANAPIVVRLGLMEGIGQKRLVPTHVELVVGTDVTSGELRDSANATIEKKVEATAAWIASNNFATTKVYTSRTADANKFAEMLGPAIESIAGSKAWCATVHSDNTESKNTATKDNFKANTFATDGVMHKVVVSVGKLKEGFNMLHLDAVVLLEPSDNPASVLQMAGRGMRAFPGKTMARVLVFGEEKAAACVSRMLHEYDREFKAVTVGVVASTYDEQIATATEGEARTAAKQKGRSFQKKIRDGLQNLATVACDNSTLRTAQVAAFVKQFAETRPKSTDSQRLHFTIDGVKCSVKAGNWLAMVNYDWHKDHGNHCLSDANKEIMKVIKWFQIPSADKKRTYAEWVADVTKFVEDNGFLPTPYAQSDGLDNTNGESSYRIEKELGIWVTRLRRTNYKSSQPSVRKELGDKAVDEFLTFLASTPTRQEFKIHQKTLDNVKGLAHECKKLRGCEGRKPWPTQRENSGMFLNDIRQGKHIGPDMQDEALDIVRTILEDPLDAEALAHLEESFSLCMDKYEEKRRRGIERAKQNYAKKRKLSEASSSTDALDGSESRDEPSPKRACGE